MGSSSSTPEKPDTTENVKKLFDIDSNDEREFLETLNISDLKINERTVLPIIGGNNEEDKYDNDVDFQLVGGANSNDLRFMARKKRYLRHNIFKILAELDNQQKGGNVEGGEEEKYLSTSSDDEAIKNIKEIIMREVNKLNSSATQSGGGCGCDSNNKDEDESENEQEGGAKKRKGKKAKKSKKQKGGDRRRKTKKTDIDSSSSDSSSSEDSSSDDDSEESYNAKRKTTKKVNLKNSESSLNSESDEENDNSSENSDNSDNYDNSDNSESEESQKGGLSIFPFNSSEVKSSVSEKKNMRMIRRKI